MNKKLNKLLRTANCEKYAWCFGLSVSRSIGISTALDWKKSVMTCINCSSCTELSLFDFDLVKKTNSDIISKTKSVSLGESDAVVDPVGDAFNAAAEMLEYNRFRASWL